MSEVEHKKKASLTDVAREKHNAAQVRLQLHRVQASHDGIIVRRDRDQGEWTSCRGTCSPVHGYARDEGAGLVPVRGISITSLEGAPMKIEVPINSSEVVTIDAKIDYVSLKLKTARFAFRLACKTKHPAEFGSFVKAWWRQWRSLLCNATHITPTLITPRELQNQLAPIHNAISKSKPQASRKTCLCKSAPKLRFSNHSRIRKQLTHDDEADSLVNSAMRPLSVALPNQTWSPKTSLSWSCLLGRQGPVGLKYFRFHEEEYAILNMLDGKTAFR